jgi:hypothetical protein
LSLDIDSPVSLKRWPNFTRLLVTPHALRISALLYKQPYTLFEAARILGVRQQYVLVLFCAAHSLGLTEIHEPQIQSAPMPVQESAMLNPEKKANTSLFRKILQRLRIS